MAKIVIKEDDKAKQVSKSKRTAKRRSASIKGMPKKISEAQAHLLVASTSAFMAPSPYMCMPTPTGQCQRFYFDPGTKQFFPKPGEPIMDCNACRNG